MWKQRDTVHGALCFRYELGSMMPTQFHILLESLSTLNYEIVDHSSSRNMFLKHLKNVLNNCSIMFRPSKEVKHPIISKFFTDLK